MAVAFTHYWIEDDNAHRAGTPLTHVASDDFLERGVKPGDSIFCVTQRDGALLLVGRMIVDQIVDAELAAQFLGHPVVFPERRGHCVCRPENGTRIRFDREIPLETVKALRFERQDGSITRVKCASDTDVAPQAMRVVRQLTNDSAERLHSMVGNDLIARR